MLRLRFNATAFQYHRAPLRNHKVVQTGAKNIEIAIMTADNKIQNLELAEVEAIVAEIEKEKEAEAEKKKKGGAAASGEASSSSTAPMEL